MPVTSSAESRVVDARDGRSANERPSLAVVACIEAGELEPKTIRMVESLRLFGGRFADAEVVAVTPRLGPPLARATGRRLAELGARHVTVRPRTNYVWHHYMNKAQAVMAVEEELEGDQLLWIDSDIIFLREPNDLELPPAVDFAASAPDTGLIGSHGADDPHDAFWARCARLIGRNVDELPWLATGDGHRIRFYWNAGLYVYRRSTSFGREFVADFERAMVKGVARNHAQVHGMDQVILGLTVLRLGLDWRAIPDTSNFPVLSFLPENFDPDKVRPVDVLHYHDSMSPQLWSALLETLEEPHPSVHDWLARLGPIEDPASRPARLAREALRIKRGLDRRVYYRKYGFTKRMTTVV
jgi:hypothetical protein